MSPERYDLISFMTQNIFDYRDGLAALKYCWLSLLALPGSCIMHRYEKKPKYVLASTEQGLLVVPARPEKHNNITVLELELGRRDFWEQLTITDFEGWSVWDIDLAPPAAYAEKCLNSDGAASGVASNLVH